MKNGKGALETQIPADTSRALSSRISGALVTFLKKVKEATLKDSLYIVFPQLVEELRESGFFVIPTRQKKPCGVNFKTQEDKEKANKRPVDTEASLILPPWLAVMDIDDPEVFCGTYGVSMEELEEVATVKTGRGYHVYVLDPEGKIHHRPLRDDGWEIKRGHNLLVVLPGSRMHHPELDKPVCYEVINPNVWEFAELPDWLRSILMQSQKDQESELPETPVEVDSETKDSETERSEVDWEKLKELILSYYSKGQRQNLVIYTAAWLKKLGISEENIWSFLENLISQAGDEEFKMRLSGIKKTLSKDEQVIKGWTGLVEDIGIPSQDLLKCIKNTKEKPVTVTSTGSDLNLIDENDIINATITGIKSKPENAGEIFPLIIQLSKSKGFPIEKTVYVVTRILEETGINRISEYVAAVYKIYNESNMPAPDEILGKLTELGIDLTLERHIIETYISKFKKVKGLLLCHKKTKKGIQKELIGPAIELQSIVENIHTGEILYECKYNNKSFLDDPEKLDIEKVTGINIVSEKGMKEYLALQTQLCPQKKYLVDRIGWFHGRFFHPAIQNESLWIWNIPNLEIFQPHEKEKQHTLIKSALKEGKLLGMLYVISLSSVFCSKGYTVFITGTSDTGKTAASIMACSIFYQALEHHMTTRGTLNGIESALKNFQNMPLLLDELRLKTIEEEELVFMIASGKTKARATKTLHLNISDLRNVVFITSERAPELHTAGAYRRCLWIPVEKSSDITELFNISDDEETAKYLALCGAGIDFLKYLNEKGIPEIKIELEGLSSIHIMARSLFKALKFFEIFYKEKFDRMNETIRTVLHQHLAEFTRRTNIIEYFVEKFLEWISSNYNHFVVCYTKGGQFGDEYFAYHVEEKPHSREIYGKLDLDNEEAFVISKWFDKFCYEYGFEKKILLKKLAEAGILLTEDSNRYVTRDYVLGTQAYGYCISLDVLDTIAEVKNQTKTTENNTQTTTLTTSITSTTSTTSTTTTSSETSTTISNETNSSKSEETNSLESEETDEFKREYCPLYNGFCDGNCDQCII